MKCLIWSSLSKIKVCMVFGLFLLGLVSPSFAAEYPYYVEPTMTNIFRALVRHGAVDIDDDTIIDSYAQTFDCPYFVKHYPDEFKWEKEREKIRNEFRANVYSYPVAFRYDALLQLGRYDFKKKVYPFYRKNMNQKSFSANTFVVDAKRGKGCGDYNSNAIPLEYKFVLGQTVLLDGLHLTEKQGGILVDRLDRQGNTDHIIYTRFNLRVKYIASLVSREVLNKAYASAKIVNKNPKQITVMQPLGAREAVIDVGLDSIEFYEDEARTSLIYTYRP